MSKISAVRFFVFGLFLVSVSSSALAKQGLMPQPSDREPTQHELTCKPLLAELDSATKEEQSEKQKLETAQSEGLTGQKLSDRKSMHLLAKLRVAVAIRKATDAGCLTPRLGN